MPLENSLETRRGAATFFPKSRLVYAGDYTEIDQVPVRRDYLAALAPDTSVKDLGLKAGLTMGERDLREPTTDGIPRVIERLGERFERSSKAVVMVAALRRAYKEGTITPMHLRRLEELERTADVNDGNIFQITIVQFIDSILGEIENDIIVTRAPFAIPLNGLRGKIPEGGWFGVDMQVDRLSEPNIQQNKFGQAEVRIKRNDIHMLMSREDRMEASIDPQAWNTMQSQANRMQARDLQALVALEGIQTSFTSAAGGIEYNSALNARVIDDPTENITGGGVFPRAKNDVPGQVQTILKAHFDRYRNRPYRIICGLDTFRALHTNWYSYRGQKPPEAGEYGIQPFPGLGPLGIKAYVSWFAPEGVLYCVGRRGFYEFDGPMSVETSYTQRKYADFTSVRDFIGYFVMNSHRYCEKIVVPLDGINTVAAGSSAGGIVEYSTFEQVEKKLMPPELSGNFKIVMQNENA